MFSELSSVKPHYDTSASWQDGPVSATTSVRQASVHAQFLWLEGQFLQSWLSSDALMAIRGSGHGPPSPDQKIAMAQEDT